MLTKQERGIVLFLIVASICGLGVLYHRSLSTSPATPQVIDNSPEEQRREVIYIDVSGAVWKPGVYELERGARVEVVLTKAMLRPDADLDAINRAALLKDGQKIVVPVKGSSIPGNYQKRININKATKEELQTLPNIGKVRSRDIINYRNINGPFTSVDELENVPGIGKETLYQLRNLIAVE